MIYKAIITDIDHTAIDSPAQKSASKRLFDSIQSLEGAGVKVSAATGRPKPWAMPAVKSMGLKHPVIVSGGTQIIDAITGEVLWQSIITADKISDVVRISKKYSDKAIWGDFNEDDYLSGGWKIDGALEEGDLNVFEIPFVADDKVDEVVGELRSIDGINVVHMRSWRDGMSDIHITNHDASKEHAVYVLEEMIGVDKSEMIGVGDSGNDIPLFKAVSYKVAAGNATDELKNLADEVIGDVKDDGLAEYLERLIEEVKK